MPLWHLYYFWHWSNYENKQNLLENYSEAERISAVPFQVMPKALLILMWSCCDESVTQTMFNHDWSDACHWPYQSLRVNGADLTGMILSVLNKVRAVSFPLASKVRSKYITGGEGSSLSKALVSLIKTKPHSSLLCLKENSCCLVVAVFWKDQTMLACQITAVY